MRLEEIIKKLYSGEISSLQGKGIGLIGDLGAGKTYFVNQLLSYINADFAPQVSSPTYNLCNVYQIYELEVHHYDLYRLNIEEELFEIGVYESLGNEQCLTFIEWVDLFPDLQKRCDSVLRISRNESEEVDYILDFD